MKKNALPLLVGILLVLGSYFTGKLLSALCNCLALSSLFGFIILFVLTLIWRFYGNPSSKMGVSSITTALQPLLKETPFIFIPIGSGFLVTLNSFGTFSNQILLIMSVSTLLTGYLIYLLFFLSHRAKQK